LATKSHTSAHDHVTRFSAAQKRIAMITISMAFIMDLLDNTIVNIAIPSIQHNLGASYSTIQWLIAGYALSFALLLITGGRMGDVFGYKKLFLFGVGGFTLASLFCGLAWSPEVLIVARLIQGGMAALMVPQVMSVMQIMFTPKERGPLMGMFGAMAGIAATLGPVIGGILIHLNIAGLDWRPIFLINIPVGLASLYMGFRYLPEGKSPHPLKLDVVGTVLIVAAMALVVYPLIQGRELDWPAWTFVMLASSLPVLALFAWWQVIKDKKDGSPLLVPSLLRIKSFVLGLIVNIVFESAMLSFFLPFTLLLQVGLGYEVIKAALTSIPTAIGISVTMALFSQKLMPKLGRYTMTIGTVVMALGLYVLYLFINHSGLNTSPWEFIPGLLLVGAGMALIMSPMFSVVLNDVDSKHAGSASGVMNAVQQLGGAIGTALIGVVFFGQLTTAAPSSFDSVAPQIKQQLSSAQVPAELQSTILSKTKTCYVDRTKQKDPSATPASCKALQPSSQEVKSLPPQQQAMQQKIGTVLKDQLKKANTNTFVSGFRAAMYFEFAILGVVFLLSFALPRYIKPGEAF
jgi:EmrB/QacA subfamily drug resistance transporter